jgi:hypothetical protein
VGEVEFGVRSAVEKILLTAERYGGQHYCNSKEGTNSCPKATTAVVSHSLPAFQVTGRGKRV